MKEKTKRNLKFIIPIIVLSAVCLGTIVWGVTAQTLAVNYSNHLENQYQKSFYQAVEGMNNIENNLSKIIVTTDSDARQQMLSEVYMYCTSVQGDLASLPLDHSSIESTLNLVNTLGGYCYAMKNVLYTGEEFTPEQSTQLEEFYQTSQLLKQELDVLVLKVLGDYRIVDNIDIKQGVSNYFTEEWAQTSQVSSSTPSLIYDGPFSQAILNQEIKGLPQTEVTKEVAQEILQGTLSKAYTIGDISYTNTTEGKFVTYNFTVTVDGGKQYNAQVCKRGGFILSIDELVTTDAISDYAKSNSEIQIIAQEFCYNIGFDTVVPIYITEMGNYAYVNLVPKIQQAYIYSDMVKVKVEKTSGIVCAFDATSYAYNHQERTDLTATLGVTEALKKVNSKIQVFSTKLCVIPLQYGGETLAYEFYGTINGDEYYVYINANTGKQENILRVVSTSEGELTY